MTTTLYVIPPRPASPAAASCSARAPSQSLYLLSRFPSVLLSALRVMLGDALAHPVSPAERGRPAAEQRFPCPSQKQSWSSFPVSLAGRSATEIWPQGCWRTRTTSSDPLQPLSTHLLRGVQGLEKDVRSLNPRGTAQSGVPLHAGSPSADLQRMAARPRNNTRESSRNVLSL